MSRWFDKADAAYEGWLEQFGEAPPLSAVVLLLAVAQHETSCGDSWPGEHNWGAVQKRVPSACEKAELAASHIVPKRWREVVDGKPVYKTTVPDARAVIQGSIDAGRCPALDREALHIDSSPKTGWYFVYFWAFPSDIEGAKFFVKIIAANRPSCKAVMLANGSPRQLAEAMYRTRYYEGVHDPDKDYPQPDGTTVKGSELNIRDYTNAVAAQAAGIRLALSGWTPGAGTPTGDTEPAPPLLPLEPDWDEIRRERDDYIREYADDS